MYREQRIDEVVLHEAGHAVVGLEVGIVPCSIQVSPDGGHHGATSFRAGPAWTSWQELALSVSGSWAESQPTAGESKWQSWARAIREGGNKDWKDALVVLTKLHGGALPADPCGSEHLDRVTSFASQVIFKAEMFGFWRELTKALQSRRRLSDIDLLGMPSIPPDWKQIIVVAITSSHQPERQAARTPTAARPAGAAWKPQMTFAADDREAFAAIGRAFGGRSSEKTQQWREYRLAIAREDRQLLSR